MKYLWPIFKVLCIALVIHALLAGYASAKPSGIRAIKFALCTTNIRSIVLTKAPGHGVKWYFVITLNQVGVRQFKQMEDRNRGRLVDVVWVGVSFGKRRLDLPIRSNAKRLFLGSRRFSRRAADAKYHLLNKRLRHTMRLNSPCGQISDRVWFQL